MNPEQNSDKNPNTIKTLMYSVIGKTCPAYKTDETCLLRQALTQMQQNNPDFGYQVLDCGILVAPAYKYNEKIDQSFNLAKTINKLCSKCEMVRKALDSSKSKDCTYTVIYSYLSCSTNCPKEVSAEDCPLRKGMEWTEQRHHVGFNQLDKNTLLIPKEHYNSKNHIYHDFCNYRSNICNDCLNKHRQR